MRASDPASSGAAIFSRATYTDLDPPPLAETMSPPRTRASSPVAIDGYLS